MDSVAGEERKKRSKALDILLLVGASLLVAAVATAGFWLADKLHVDPA
jgi:flagellar basal body-associated protein FliL